MAKAARVLADEKSENKVKFHGDAAKKLSEWILAKNRQLEVVRFFERVSCVYPSCHGVTYVSRVGGQGEGRSQDVAHRRCFIFYFFDFLSKFYSYFFYFYFKKILEGKANSEVDNGSCDIRPA